MKFIIRLAIGLAVTIPVLIMAHHLIGVVEAASASNSCTYSYDCNGGGGAAATD